MALSIPALAENSETEQAYPVTGGNLYYGESPDYGITIYEVDKTVTEAVIPDQINGVAVRKIYPSALMDCPELTSVVLPNSLDDTSWYLIWFQSSSKLTKVTLSARTEEFTANDVLPLIDVTVPADNPRYTDVNGIVFSKDLTEFVYFPAGRNDSAYAIPNTVTKIADYAFYGSKLSSITIPESVTAIGYDAFGKCENLASIAIPASVTEIMEGAFDELGGLKDIYYAGSKTQWEAICPYSRINESKELEGITVHYGSAVTPEQPAQPEQPATQPAPAATPTVVLSPQKLAVNGETKATEIYNIDNTNYFKLRDLAALLNGTSSRFNVDFDSARNTIVVTTGVSYTTATGHELETGADNSASAVVSPQSIEIDGKAVELTAYNIGNTNFFGLRALQPYLGYEVDWIAETNTATIATK